MVRKTKAVIVDTYAIMADLKGEAPSKAIKYLDMIRLGRIEGYLHYLIVYELVYHWRKGRLPFKDQRELREFVNTYFKLIDISLDVALEASQVKIIGDRLLQKARDLKLKKRKLSIADVTSITLALKYGVPVITGDIDLSYVAKSLGIEVLW